LSPAPCAVAAAPKKSAKHFRLVSAFISVTGIGAVGFERTNYL
jgi:hypothetical protein